MKVVKELDILDIEEAIHDLAGIAVLVESVEHRIATVGTTKSDENAFSQIAELILQKQEVFEKFFNDYRHIKQVQGGNNE